MIRSNPELDLAGEYVRETGATIFLTGKAGTGKTTFLQNLRKDCAKRLIVTAPTGVAAINAGGVTLHSFFQLPFGPYLPGTERKSAGSHFRFSKEKINIIKSLDLLIIDEISMVRSDLLDGVDSILRRFRRNSLPFGGVQLLMIGDLHQLPPVVKNNEWQLLSSYYDSPFFFSSRTLCSIEMVTIELKQIFRQKDDAFIAILNQVRANSLSPSSLIELNKRVIKDFSVKDEKGYITLCTHNSSADSINQEKLEQLPHRLHQYEADVEGEFPDHTYPASATLELKEGAQVMFIRNDSSSEKLYFNGKIGVITKITGDTVQVKCPEDTVEIEVEPATWDNIEYSLNQETLEITETKIGSFRQYPLRHAWAITIHKSQGLTFDKAVIDAQAAFAHGQVYVALSRCRTLDGMILMAPLSGKTLRADKAILHFTKNKGSLLPTQSHLGQEKINYQQRLILECFDYSRLAFLLQRAVSLVAGSQSLIQVSGVKSLSDLQLAAQQTIFSVSGNFQRQLNGLFRGDRLPSDDPTIIERLAKASVYFSNKISSVLKPETDSLSLDTDNKELRRKCRNVLEALIEETGIKLAAALSCENGFSSARYLTAVATAALEVKKPKKKVVPTYAESDIDHPQLFMQLKNWRSRKADEEGLAHFQVMHQKTLVQLAVNLPESLTALKRLKGIGTKLADRYGAELIEIVAAYRKDNKIEHPALPAVARDTALKKEKSPAMGDTRKITLELSKKGLSPEEISKQRDLTLNTIEKHIAFHIEKGNIEASSLFEPQRFAELLPRVKKLGDTNLKKIKENLDNSVSYSEIHYLMAHLRHCRES